MPNWTESMQRTYEYYIVDPASWEDVKKLDMVEGSSIKWDLTTETLGSATYKLDNIIGECYIRTYMIVNQNGITEKIPMGTFLIQTPSTTSDGKRQSISADAYSPLLELKEKYPEIGFFIPKNTSIMDRVTSLTKDNLRAPVIKSEKQDELINDIVADPNDTWLAFLNDVMTNVKFSFALDEMGRVLFAPKQELEALQPVWTYNSDNSSILYADVTTDRDLYGVPNVVEVMCSNGTESFHIIVENNDIDSPTSIVNRGRKIVYRDTNPSIIGTATKDRVQEYAETLLKELSSVDYTVNYTHAYCPVRIGDCVRLNYPKAGLVNVKAKVISQNISCTPDCPVSETAVFTAKLWR